MKKDALIIFVRNPVLGKVKTRIAASIGDANALKIYLHLLQYTKQITLEVNVSKHIFYSDEMNQNDLWNGNDKQLQSGNNLGERMKNAFKCIFEKGYGKVIIIGSDCFELTPSILSQAFNDLDTFDIVLGPAKDGGYYLLGMSSLYLFLFNDIQWSTKNVLKRTIQIISQNKLSYSLLQKLSDVDEAKDITFIY